MVHATWCLVTTTGVTLAPTLQRRNTAHTKGSNARSECGLQHTPHTPTHISEKVGTNHAPLHYTTRLEPKPPAVAGRTNVIGFVHVDAHIRGLSLNPTDEMSGSSHSLCTERTANHTRPHECPVPYCLATKQFPYKDAIERVQELYVNDCLVVRCSHKPCEGECTKSLSCRPRMTWHGMHAHHTHRRFSWQSCRDTERGQR